MSLDGYLRANDVFHSRKNNDPNWELKADVPGVSSGAGIVAGGAAAVGADYLVKDLVGWAYDQW